MGQFPDDSVQDYVEGSDWWIEDKGSGLRRGRLLWAFVPFVDAEPLNLVAEGRTSPTDHTSAKVRIVKVSVTAPTLKTLPVAGLSVYKGEVYLIQKAKKRPALVMAHPHQKVSLPPTASPIHAFPSLTVAPYYGAVADGTRAGFPSDFVDRIRQGLYPQYVWDRLPIGGTTESILRLDHLQTIGRDQQSYELTDYRLSDGALAMLDDWLTWFLRGGLPAGGKLDEARKFIAELAAG